jgi:hypothetical protein
MSEQSTEEYIRTLERRFNRQKRVRSFLFEAALSAAITEFPIAAQMAYDERRKIDALPHD